MHSLIDENAEQTFRTINLKKNNLIQINVFLCGTRWDNFDSTKLFGVKVFVIVIVFDFLFHFHFFSR